MPPLPSAQNAGSHTYELPLSHACWHAFIIHSLDIAVTTLHRYSLDYDCRPSGPRAYGSSSSACPLRCIAISSHCSSKRACSSLVARWRWLRVAGVWPRHARGGWSEALGVDACGARLAPAVVAAAAGAHLHVVANLWAATLASATCPARPRCVARDGVGYPRAQLEG